MGADLSVDNGKGFSRVVDVDGSFFKVRVDGKELMIPTRNGTSCMRLDDPYLLVVARIHEPGEKPDLFRNWIFAPKLDADGNAVGTLSDEDCKSAVNDPYVTALVAKVLFAPALDKGKPVPGVARLLLGGLLNLDGFARRVRWGRGLDSLLDDRWSPEPTKRAVNRSGFRIQLPIISTEGKERNEESKDAQRPGALRFLCYLLFKV